MAESVLIALSGPLQAASLVLLAVTLGVALVRALRRPRRPEVDVAALFASLTVATLAQQLTGLAPAGTDIRGTSALAAAALAFFVLRLADDQSPVPRAARILSALALAGIAASFFAAPRGAVWPYALVAVSFLAHTGYAALAFARAAASAGGAPRRRLSAIAVGTALLLASTVPGALMTASPDASLRTALIAFQQAVALGSVVAYLIGFAPPVWLIRLWREPQLREFIAAAPDVAGIEDHGDVLDRLAERVRDAMGADSARIMLLGPGGGVLVRGPDGTVEVPAAQTLTGRSLRADRGLISFAPARDSPAFADEFRRTGARMVMAAPIRLGGRPIGAMSVRSTSISLFAEDDLDFLEALAHETAVILRTHELVRELRTAADHRRAIIEHAVDAYFATDTEGKIIDWSKRATDLLGWSEEEAVGRRAAEIVLPHPAESRIGRTVETTALRRDGVEVPVEVAVTPVTEGARTLLATFLRDVTERRQLELERERHLDQDALTGLASARLLHQHLLETHMTAAVRGHPYAVLFINVDAFAEVNHAFGHQAGDRVLAEIAARLQRLVRETDVVARWSGDQFVILLPRDGLAGAKRLAERVLGSFGEPFTVENEEIELGASIGLAVHPDHAADVPTLLGRADAAMREAKRATSAYALPPTEQSSEPLRPHALRADLRKAIAAKQLELAYQPVVDLRRGRVVRFEALARWHHPMRGPVPPREFIDLAERTGLIRQLTTWALERALADVRVLHAADRELQVSVNLSTQAFADPALADRIHRLCEASGVPPRALGVEITESILMAEPVHARATVARLRALGTHIEIDDFGTGYSSLGYLQHLPADGLKIDRQFVAAMAADARSDAIVRATIALAHELGFRVVAEGVEDETTWRSLAAAGCDLAQGYLIAPPMPISEVRDWLARWQPPTVSAPAPDRHVHVLVVDDDQALVSVVRDVLEDNGYAVGTATSGDEALAVVDRLSPRVLLVDVHMPSLDGPALACALRERGVTAPIVVMTAGPSAMRWAERMGAAGHLSKPFEVRELLDVTRRFVA
ncbi:MAG TPA: EAL domain-containing protein [Candidatus Limnocylindria bacterium]|nr:EAL domain-containing protein [Candidatus Limnocylindria bacterium]